MRAKMGSVARLACAIVVAWVATAAAQPSPQQKIAISVKPSVVRVWGAYIATYEIGGEKVQQAIGGTGTGFFITPDGYIATNAHVVSDIHEGDEEAKKALYQSLLRDLEKAFKREIEAMSDAQVEQFLKAIKLVDLEKRAYVVLPNGDQLPYEIKQYGKPGSGRDAAIIKVKTENAPTLPIGDSNKTQIADQIVVLGYPGVADMKELLDEKSQLQASDTDGAISSLKKANTGEPILQISAPITHGNSGGPALDLKGNVVGLATFGNEGEVQGFNFLVASATLMELVKDGKIEPKPSETNKLWREGLEQFWADHYSAAISKFEQVQALYPQHSEVAGLITQAIQAKKDGKEKKTDGGSTGLIVGLVIGGIVVVGLFMIISRRKKPGAGPRPQQAPMSAPGFPPPGQPPQGFAPPPGFPPPQGFAPPQQQGFAPPQQQGFPPPQQQGFAPPQQQGFAPPPQSFAPPQMPPPAQGFAPPQQQMYGRVPSPSQPPPMGFTPPQQMGAHTPGGHQPVAKTMAIQPSAAPAGGIAPTAFGSLSVGSLTCTRGQLNGQRFALTATGIIVGRQPGVAHVLVNDHRASGKHVWIGIDQGRLVAIDQGTTNGTYINDVARGRITRQELRDGDVVIVGEPDCLSLQVKLG
jgi:S1-C subfamily serine protease